MIEFKSVDIDKRDRIVNAALKEFSHNSFEKASTNNIVKIAKVSKGLLYHYFKSKEELYIYLKDFVFVVILDSIKEKLNWEQDDFFERLKEITLIKINITNQYPEIYNFAMNLIKETSLEEMKAISQKYSLALLQKVYYENINFEKFKEDINIEKAMQIIQWTFEKYAEELSRRETIDNTVILQEVDEYLDMLRSAFYK